VLLNLVLVLILSRFNVSPRAVVEVRCGIFDLDQEMIIDVDLSRIFRVIGVDEL
jgi:hypothetical protein